MTFEERTKKLADLQNQQNELYTKLDYIREQIHEIELDGMDYVGKFIHIKNYGYMYVTYQEIDKQMHTKECMWFKGFFFNVSVSKYTDDFFFECDASKDWFIPMRTFVDYYTYDTIDILTEDKFITIYKELYEKFNNNALDMLGTVIDNTVLSNNKE